MRTRLRALDAKFCGSANFLAERKNAVGKYHAGFNIGTRAANLLSSSSANRTASTASLEIQPVTVNRDAQGLLLLSDLEV